MNKWLERALLVAGGVALERVREGYKRFQDVSDEETAEVLSSVTEAQLHLLQTKTFAHLMLMFSGNEEVEKNRKAEESWFRRLASRQNIERRNYGDKDRYSSDDSAKLVGAVTVLFGVLDEGGFTRTMHHLLVGVSDEEFDRVVDTLSRDRELILIAVGKAKEIWSELDPKNAQVLEALQDERALLSKIYQEEK